MRSRQFDIVLSDMAMPGELDGLGFAEYLRNRHPEIQVVLMTGYTNQLQEAVARRFTVFGEAMSARRIGERDARSDSPAQGNERRRWKTSAVRTRA